MDIKDLEDPNSAAYKEFMNPAALKRAEEMLNSFQNYSIDFPEIEGKPIMRKDSDELIEYLEDKVPSKFLRIMSAIERITLWLVAIGSFIIALIALSK